MGKPQERFIVKIKTKNNANLEKTIKQIRKRGISYREWQLEKEVKEMNILILIVITCILFLIGIVCAVFFDNL